jgi:hypothetical protein
MKTILMGVAASVLFACPLISASEWVEDPISGCAIWNAEPSTNGDVVSWSGECINEKASGHGVLSWFADGELLARYVGTLVAGRLDGIVIDVIGAGIVEGSGIVIVGDVLSP